MTYHWLITYSVPDDLNHPGGVGNTARQVFDRIVTSNPRLHYTFPYSPVYGGIVFATTPGVDPGSGQPLDTVPAVYSLNTAYGPLDFWADYLRLLRSPVQVLLRVQQDHPNLAQRQVKTITFTNPELTAKEASLEYNTENMNFFGLVKPFIFDVSGGHSCPSLTDRAFFGISALPRSVAVAKLAHLSVSLSRGSLIVARVGCKNSVKDCLASLDVLSGAPKLRRAKAQSAIAHRSLPPLLGRTTVAVPAGRTIAVLVRLNARGKALVRSHHLHQVTLLLESAGAEGKMVITTRTVRLRAGR
jgi:hypothetical protein